MRIEVFDPPMCCSSGVCGPKVDPGLARFASDLEWFRAQGLAVARYNLAQQPLVFAQNPAVRDALEGGGGVLPLVLADGRIVCRGKYPARAELAAALGIACGPEAGGGKGGACCA